jgi:hypothetical protein
MKILVAFLVLGACCTQVAVGQSPAPTTRTPILADLTVATNGTTSYGAASLVRLHSIGTRGKWKIGYGLRFTGASVSDGEFITAPALLTSGQEGPHVIFLETIEANLDTLTLSNSIYSLNAAFYLEYALSSRWGLGFNIDVVGFSFGPSATGVFQSSLTNPSRSIQTASPTSFNLLLGSESDLGSLNSELYATYLLNNRWTLRGGAGFLFSEVTTDRELTFENDRFRLKSLTFSLSARYRLN